MAFQAASQTVLVEFKFTGNQGQLWQNNLHFQKSTFTDSDIDDLVSAVSAAVLASDYWDYVSADATFTSCVGTDLRTEGAYQKILAVGNVGDNVGAMAALGSPLVVTLRTAVRGRSYRGRVYLSGWYLSSVDNGQYGAAFKTAGYDLIDDIATAASTYGFNLCVLSRYHNGSARATALPELVTDYEVRSGAPGSQRRRNDRP